MNRDFLRRHLPSVSFVIAALVGLVIAAAALIYNGAYNVAADDPHSKVVYSLMDELRERSITTRARNIAPPNDLASPERIARGAGLYSEMCVSCHLGPGVEPSEMSQGLNPQAPQLAKASHLTAAQRFWIIKHGIKMSAMPAWGKTHPDPLIWDMVAFAQALPGMTATQFQQTLADAPADHDEMMDGMGEDHHATSGQTDHHSSAEAADDTHHDDAGTAPHTH